MKTLGIKTRKSQTLSLDLLSSFVVFLMLIALFVTLIVFSDVFEKPKSYDFELDYIFPNFENNLNNVDNHQNIDFLSSSRVDTLKLKEFALEYQDESVDDLLIGNADGKTLGIGIYPEAYDTCLYFTDNDGSAFDMGSGIDYLGNVIQNSVENSCQSILEDSRNPCEGYKDAVSIFKPVLLDFNDPTQNRIVQMNVVVCII